MNNLKINKTEKRKKLEKRIKKRGKSQGDTSERVN